jgi:hypothetical protein
MDQKTKSAIDYDDPELYTRQAAGGMGGGGGGSYSGPTHGGDAGIRGLSAQQASMFEKKKKKERRKAGEAGGSWQREDEVEEEEPEERSTAAHRLQPKFDYAGAQLQQTEAVSQQQQQHNQQHQEKGEEEDEEAAARGGGSRDLESSPEWRLVEVRRSRCLARFLTFCFRR